jgi:hypothetical protein
MIYNQALRATVLTVLKHRAPLHLLYLEVQYLDFLKIYLAYFKDTLGKKFFLFVFSIYIYIAYHILLL